MSASSFVGLIATVPSGRTVFANFTSPLLILRVWSENVICEPEIFMSFGKANWGF